MKTLNRVYLLGSVGRDPELKTTASGTLIANFSLATSERFKDSAGNWRERTEWHSLVAWARTAEVVRDYVSKGTPLHIEGKLQTRSWESDGKKQYRTEIVIENLILLGGQKKTETTPKQAHNDFQSPAAAEDDDVPF